MSRRLQAVAHALLGLFVDDTAFAAAILAWVGLVALAVRTGMSAAWVAPAFVAGLAALLVGSVLLRARR